MRIALELTRRVIAAPLVIVIMQHLFSGPRSTTSEEMPEQPEQGRPREPSLGVLLSPCIVTVELPAHQPNDDAGQLAPPESGQTHQENGHNFFFLHTYIYPVLQVRILYIPRKVRIPPYSWRRPNLLVGRSPRRTGHPTVSFQTTVGI